MKKNYADFEYMGTKEAAERWGIEQYIVRDWCRKNRIPNVEQDEKGSPYRIPRDAFPPNYKEE